MAKPKTHKIIYNPDGEPVRLSFANAYDLLAHVPGWSASAPKTVSEEIATDEDVNEEETNEDESEADSEVPDFEAFTKAKLEEYALENYGVDLDRRKSQSALAGEVMRLYVEHNAD